MKPPIPAAALAQHVIVLGKTRSGKSSKLRVLVEGLLEEDKPVCIVDPKGDWWGLKSAADGKHAGFPVVIFGGPHADVPLNPRAGAQVAELIATGNRPCLIDLKGWMPGDRTRFFIDFASTLFKHHRGERYLVIDEVHNFAPKGKVLSPDAGTMLHWANRLASEGQGMGLVLLAASQRPQKVHNDLLTSCETLIACRVIHKADRDAIKDWIDGCADPAIGKQVLAELASMKRAEAWCWSPEIEFGPERITWPLFGTYDSFKPQQPNSSKLKGWAEVDLEEVKSRLAAVLEEARASDPAELRKQIADLRKQVQTNPGKTEQATREDLAAAEAKGYQRGRADGDRAFDKELRSLQKLASPLSDNADKLLSHISILTNAIAQALHHEQYPEAPRPTQVAQLKAPSPARARTIPRTNGHAEPIGGDLTPVQQRILNALAEAEQLSAEAPDRALVAILSGYTHIQSTGFVKALGGLSSSGLVTYPPGGRVALTDAGRELAQMPEAPTTAEDLQQRVIDLVGGAAAKVLKPLIDANREPMTRQDLANASGYTHVQSTGFVKVLGKLRTLGFIDYGPGSTVIAQPVLFLEGA